MKKSPDDLEKANEILEQEIEGRKELELSLRQSEKDLRTSHTIFETVLDHIDALVHASDLETYEVVFANKYTKDIFGDIPGKLCWQTIQQGQNGPCPFCKNDSLLNNDGIPTGVTVWETHNILTNKWFQVRACAVRWIDGRMVRLSVASDITQRRQIEEMLRAQEKEVKKKAQKLEEINIALRVLLQKREQDKIELEQKIFSNVIQLVYPYMENLENSGLNHRQTELFSIIKSNLKGIISPFLYKLSSMHSNLTPREIQVASLVKAGKTTKEIAELLNSTTVAIEFHRKNLRKKFGISKTKTNLRNHLLSLSK